jgi:hypothetical protein
MREDLVLEKRDIKKSRPFCWQDKRIIRFLRKKYTNKKLTTAIAIYSALSELSSNSGKFEGYFVVSYGKIGEMVGKSGSTAKRYCNEFIQLQILQKKLSENGKFNNSNNWRLLQFLPMRHLSGHNKDQVKS